MASPISYVEIGAGDARAVGAFFAELFGWSFHPMGTDGGGWFQAGSIKAGLHGGEAAPRIDLFFQVPNLAAAVERVRALGGQVDGEIAEEPGFGKFAQCHAPGGLSFGLHQPEASSAASSSR
ncbi:putative enzyme related to lactoylglutathione lyase [Chromobacterium alkanivorans]|uniref:VOC family protein n=1 Tax=Chromobacterium TaxID=535 RepID=UPI0005B81E00|nr:MULTISPECIES: VOC family protein [Chromobacterium]KMN82721.1 hypothetical protein VK98_06695 [Chromobacterium sp. LK11]MCS3804575.1 putative enzyme related to lactoylglutathione lyase [Chromobacterium alkanivorans]MCS3818914.1 putative enzyme related to lactoylglutathione lyase [Chromobacterium alkanivorans]MCS3873228.1 putative enzyme related to lactoylglutathione lyase [Chromobacterium alkanivorans]